MKKSTKQTARENSGKTKRQQILDAASVVFSRKGFHRATVDEIITMADTGKGTVYNYFVNKEQLFYTLVKEKSAPFHERIRAIEASDAAALDKMYGLTREFLYFYAENADLWRVLMHEMRTFGSENIDSVFSTEQQVKYRKNFENALGTIESVICQGIEQQIMQPCNTRQAAFGLFSAIVAIVFQRLIGDDPELTARSIADTFLFGIVARRPENADLAGGEPLGGS